MSNSIEAHPGRAARVALRAAAVMAIIAVLTFKDALAVPSFARQTGMPCSQCHTLSFGPALTDYGRQFKLNGYSWGDGEHPLPLALMIQGGFSHVDASLPEAPAEHFSTNNNLSVDQVSIFYGGRITEHSGAFVQVTYSGEERHTSWDNMDVRYARAVKFAGTDAVIGVSINNNPTVQDLWNSTPAWGFPYISSPLVPGPSAATLIEGGLAQTVLGATAYAMIADHVYLEGGAYRNLSDRWLGNLGLGPGDNPHINGVAPYWRLAYQVSKDPYYFSIGTFGIEAKLQPDTTVPDTDRYSDVGFDATYQYANQDQSALTVNASYIHENQKLSATFNAGGVAAASNHLNTLRLDASFTYHQTWSAGVGVFDITGGADQVFYGPAPLSGSNNGSPDTRGYILQLEYVPFGKMTSWGRPWVNVRVGLQYTGYLKFNGGTSDYDGFGRTAHQNNSVFLFSWLAF
ncbi:MAG: putative cytochrome c1 signal peptide protein [Gammaproteobacteria bacterium]|nr:putative cytochrome c1 signal peptide protein [Gammaproteobacteria bacterium]